MVFNLGEVQQTLNKLQFDGWLFHDYGRSNDIAHYMLNLNESILFTRRVFYWVPKIDDPIKVCHRTEMHSLDGLPGNLLLYSNWRELNQILKQIVENRRIAMEYSPKAAIPSMSKLDAGTYELIVNLGGQIYSSADLVQYFQCRLSDDQLQSHRKAALLTRQIIHDSFSYIWDCISSNEAVSEYDVQQFIIRQLGSKGLQEVQPLVAFDKNTADPYYRVNDRQAEIIVKNGLVAIDVCTRLSDEKSIFTDQAYMGYTSDKVPNEIGEVFHLISTARDETVQFIKERFILKEPVYGYEVDDICRQVINDNGMEDYFIQRTGHNIGEQVYGYGVNFDNYETYDTRQLLPGTCYSIEPGLYIPNQWGMKTEINILITNEGNVEVTSTPIQNEVIPIMK